MTNEEIEEFFYMEHEIYAGTFDLDDKKVNKRYEVLKNKLTQDEFLIISFAFIIGEFFVKSGKSHAVGDFIKKEIKKLLLKNTHHR